MPVIAERSTFYGANWEVGTSGVGTTLTATQWLFADGSVSTDTDTYYLLANDVLYANVTMTFRRTDGGVVTYTVSVPPRARVSVDPRSVPRLAVPGWFAVEVNVTNGVAIVAERATYHLAFPGWVRGSVSLGRRP
ncbi:MAG: hypothetical protein U0Q12_03200 [Vicinamibacterales bacterium]